MFSANVFGQINNLVPNGDFEDINYCFEQIDGLKKVPHWSAAVPPVACSSDYYNKCQLTRPWLPKEPIYSVIGNGSAAILLKTSESYYREYLQSQLLLPLISGEEYVVEFKILPVYWENNWEWSVYRIESLISSSKPNATIYNNLPSIILQPASLVFQKGYTDTTTWYQCRAVYKAVGGAQYLTIGVFSPDSVYDFYPIGQNLQTAWKAAYYLIDDVMVYKASDTIKQLPEPVLPNVFSPNQDGINEVYAIENLPENSTLEVFNRWGGLVFTQAPYQNNWPGNAPNGNPVADGVYFAILTYQDAQGVVQQKKQTVHVVR
jgi:gliding motility-associated-like protein